MHDITIVSIIFTAALALICLFLILTPFFKWQPLFSYKVNHPNLVSTKESLLTTLNELEFEFKMDKISPTDYKILKKQYETEVANIMKEEEQLTHVRADKDLMAEVEREIEEQMKMYKHKKGEGK
ncbi:hypothetical protein [Bacillus sp. JJ1764]|uniref:hypothetical protein n=1 Tax=Bacillus sp. JJ1764 TaxID=3122964 RepID=UPI002FFD81C5